MYWWARDYPVTDAASEAEVTEVSACAVYQWLREVCSTHLLHTLIRLGGPSVVVQIDESLMNHKPKVILIIVTIIRLYPAHFNVVSPWAETCY